MLIKDRLIAIAIPKWQKLHHARHATTTMQLTCARVHYGLASTMLGQLPVGGCVPGTVRTLQPDFHLPDDKSAPFSFQRAQTLSLPL